MSATMQTVAAVTTVGCGLMAGVYFAFSAFVMPGLNRTPAQAAVTAMQGINEAALTPAFMTVFVATALLCLAMAVWGVLSWQEARAKLVLAGSALYLVGSCGVTAAANVPLNDTLARVTGPGVARAWQDYYAPWLVYNHLRALTTLAATTLFVIALTRA